MRREQAVKRPFELAKADASCRSPAPMPEPPDTCPVIPESGPWRTAATPIESPIGAIASRDETSVGVLKVEDCGERLRGVDYPGTWTRTGFNDDGLPVYQMTISAVTDPRLGYGFDGYLGNPQDYHDEEMIAYGVTVEVLEAWVADNCSFD